MLAVTSETSREGATFSIIQATFCYPVSKYFGHVLGIGSKLRVSVKPQAFPSTSFWVQAPIVKGLLRRISLLVVSFYILKSGGFAGPGGGVNVFTVQVTILT